MFETTTSDQVVPVPVEWLWQERIPKGMLSIVAGRPGEGKSIFSNFLAAEVSHEGNVLMSNMEDLRSFVRMRLEAAGARTDRVHFGNPLFPRDYHDFADFVREQDVKLVILDPIAAHFRVSIYQDQECRVVLTPLAKLAEETGCSIVGVHHTTKTTRKSAHPLDSIGGGQGGLAAAARAVYLWGPNPHDSNERVLAHVKSNVGAKRASVLFEHDFIDVAIPGKPAPVPVGMIAVLDDDSEITAKGVLHPDDARGVSDAITKRAAACEWLTEYLSLGPMPVVQLRDDAQEDGFSWATMRRASKEVPVEIHRQGFGPGSKILWALPEDHPALLANETGFDVTLADDVSIACCLDPELEQHEDGSIVCASCSSVIGQQGSLDELGVAEDGDVHAPDELCAWGDDGGAAGGED